MGTFTNIIIGGVKEPSRKAEGEKRTRTDKKGGSLSRTGNFQSETLKKGHTPTHTDQHEGQTERFPYVLRLLQKEIE